MSSDWDEEEDQTKDKDKDQKQPQPSPSLLNIKTTYQQTSITYTPNGKHRCDTIVAKQELNTTECKAMYQDLLEDID